MRTFFLSMKLFYEHVGPSLNQLVRHVSNVFFFDLRSNSTKIFFLEHSSLSGAMTTSSSATKLISITWSTLLKQVVSTSSEARLMNTNVVPGQSPISTDYKDLKLAFAWTDTVTKNLRFLVRATAFFWVINGSGFENECFIVDVMENFFLGRTVTAGKIRFGKLIQKVVWLIF